MCLQGEAKVAILRTVTPGARVAAAIEVLDSYLVRHSSRASPDRAGHAAIVLRARKTVLPFAITCI